MTTFRKKKRFDLKSFDPIPRVEGVSVAKIFATMLLHVCDNIPKKFNFGLGPTPKVHPRGLYPDIQTKILFDMFLPYCFTACMQNFSKILTTALVLAKFKYFTFDPLGGSQRVGVKF